MRLVLINREKLQALGAALVGEFDNLIARIRAGWNVEHNEDGTHKQIRTDTVTTGRVVYSGIVTATLTLPITHNFNPPELSTASVLRIDPGTMEAPLVTGLQVPQDEAGVILDGRVLIVENVSETGKALRLAHDTSPDGQGSIARNRMRLPRHPTLVNAQAEFVIHPASFVTLIYNAAKARWMIAAQYLDSSVSYFTFGSSGGPIDLPRAVKTWRLIAAAPDLGLAGINSDTIPDDEIKTVVNDGAYNIFFYHAYGAASPATGRIYCPGGIRYMLHPRESMQIQKIRGGGWRILSKADQWIDVPYNAANFQIAGAGTWTVPSSAVLTFNYQIDGNRMTVSFQLQGWSITGAPDLLQVVIPDNRVAAREARNRVGQVIDDFGIQPTTFVRVAAGSPYLFFYRDGYGFPWKPTTFGYLNGQITFMVRDDYGMAEVHTDVGHADTPHGDAEHGDVTHTDTAHVDTHGDTPHGDSSHGDVGHTNLHSDIAHTDTHSDTPHTNTHGDAAHTDIPHTDFNHQDYHEDVAHTDVAHDDIPFDDQPFIDDHADYGHTDWHTDTPHGDQHQDGYHQDGPHSDLHYDWHMDYWSPNHGDAHDDYHEDVNPPVHEDTPHSDQGHEDVHGDQPHGDFHNDEFHEDFPHHDTSHKDVAHSDYHSDAAAQYSPHYDVPHTNTHSDVAHVNTHSDVPHTNTHGDTPHSDSTHTDVPYIYTHSDSPHQDVAHVNTGHQDAGHGDAAHQDIGLHTDSAHTDI